MGDTAERLCKWSSSHLFRGSLQGLQAMVVMRLQSDSYVHFSVYGN
jgi:hypothetical protein